MSLSKDQVKHFLSLSIPELAELIGSGHPDSPFEVALRTILDFKIQQEAHREALEVAKQSLRVTFGLAIFTGLVQVLAAIL